MRELEAEVARLQRELERVSPESARPASAPHNNARPDIPAYFYRPDAPRFMVWVALGLCGVGLLFALFALARHG